MNKTDYPVKKTFSQDFILKDKTLFTLEYEQATINEFFEFYSLSPEKQILEIKKLINKQIPKTFLDRLKKKLNIFYKTKIEKLIDYDKIILNVIWNKFRMYKSIFSDVKVSEKKMTDKWLFSVSVSTICMNYCISPKELLENFTLEQFFWFLDWVTYKWNLQSKEGQNINKLALVDKEAVKKRLEDTKKAFNS